MTCLMTPYIRKWALLETSRAIRKKPPLLQLEASFGRQTCSSKRGYFFKDTEELLTLGPLLMSGSTILEIH